MTNSEEAVLILVLSASLYAMAEEYINNESYAYSQTASPSEMTPLVSSGEFRKRIASVQSVLGWEKVGSDDDIDQEVSYRVCLC